jgi:DNA-binding transcriptional MerR regulator
MAKIYTIHEIANILGVQTKTIRVLKRYLSPGLLRRNGEKLYSHEDLKRLSFIQELLRRGFNVDLLQDYLAFYPCWLRDDCPECMSTRKRVECAKPCWKENGTFCRVSLEQQNMCETCRFSERRDKKVIPFTSGRK